MKQIILFMATTLTAVFAQAEVYRCQTQDGFVYSERHCASDATPIKNLSKKPSEENVRAAQSRLENDIHLIEEKDRQDQAVRHSIFNSQTMGVGANRIYRRGAR